MCAPLRCTLPKSPSPRPIRRCFASLLGVSVALSEAEVHWRAFFQSLVQRGLCGVQFIVSDDHSGMAVARQAVFGAVPWQRCQFHLQQNAQAYVPRISLGERMGGMTPDQRRDWLDKTFFAGIAEAKRPAKFIYRAPLSAGTGSGGMTSEENDRRSRAQIESLIRVVIFTT